MKKVTFYCDFCGAEVDRDDRVCPSCGKSFSAVRCPRCGRTGPARLFKDGCPDCGYSAEGGGEKAAVEPRERIAPERPLGALGWSLVVLIFLSSLAALLFVVLR